MPIRLLRQASAAAAPGGGGDTALEQAFAAMSAGTFADYTSATNDGFSLIATPGGNILEYGSRGFHDAVHGKLQYLGSDHDGDELLITLDMASNAWTSEAGPFDGGGFHHTNYMVAMDPATGDLYAAEVAGVAMRKKPYGQAWTAIANRPWAGNGIIGLDWNPGLNGGGGLVFLDSAGIASWNPGNDTWTTLSSNAVNGGYLDMFAVTLDNNVSYLGGGAIEGGAITDWWQVTADGTDSQMANDIPIPMGISGKGLVLPHPDGTTALCFGGSSADTNIREFDPTNAAAGWPVIGTHSLVSNDGSEWKIGIVVRSEAGANSSGILWLQTDNAALTCKLYKA